MSEILTERSGSILRIQLNRPEKKNAMTSDMYVTLAELLNAAARDEQIRVVLWHGDANGRAVGGETSGRAADRQETREAVCA
jgi:enoyl-CoA hydratase/carnithine racemase